MIGCAAPHHMISSAMKRSNDDERKSKIRRKDGGKASKVG